VWRPCFNGCGRAVRNISHRNSFLSDNLIALRRAWLATTWYAISSVALPLQRAGLLGSCGGGMETLKYLAQSLVGLLVVRRRSVGGQRHP
jgi:hypothetical protein